MSDDSSNSSSSSSNSDSGDSDEKVRDKLKKLKRKLKREERKAEKRLKRKLRKEKRKLKKAKRSKEKQHRHGVKASSPEKPEIPEKTSNVPIRLMEKSKAMAPMTKEEWEKRQSVIRKVLDEESGRYRLIKGDGEVLEEIVSQKRHKEINRQATKADGDFFQSVISKR